jgi:hypothetical protein
VGDGQDVQRGGQLKEESLGKEEERKNRREVSIYRYAKDITSGR